MGAIRRIFIRVGAFIVDFEGRTLILSVLSLLANLFYATSFLFTAIISRSVFYCALSIYHLIIGSMRRGVLRTYAQREEWGDSYRERQLQAYRRSGILMIVLHLLLSGSMADIIFTEGDYRLPRGAVGVSVAYAVYKITSAAYNTFKARRSRNPAVRAMRSISLADASASVLLLQRVLVDGPLSERVAFNSVSVAVVTLFSLSLGIYTIVSANRELLRAKKGK